MHGAERGARIKKNGPGPRGPRPYRRRCDPTDYLVVIEPGTGPVDGVSLVPERPLPGPPGVLAMVGLLFGLVWFICVPEVLGVPDGVGEDEPVALEPLAPEPMVDELEAPVLPVEDVLVLLGLVEVQAPRTKTAARGRIHLFIKSSSESMSKVCA